MNTHSPKTISPLVRWIFPSIKDILFLGYLLGPSLIDQSGVLNDSDTGWHIRNGEYILQNRSFPHSDYFSFTRSGHPWFAWEWLSDVILAIIHKYLGLNGIALWANLTFAATFTLLFWWMARGGGNILIALLFSRLAGYAAAVHWLARPHLFTLFLVLIWYFLLQKIQHATPDNLRFTRRTIWILPLLMILWTNLHGGFVAGVILMSIYAFGNFLDSLTNPNEDVRRQARLHATRFSKLTILCGAVTMINPYGFLVHKHIYDSYLHSQFLVDRITEFSSPNFHTSVVVFFELILLASIVISGISSRRFTFIEIGVVIFWTHMAVFSVRHIPLYTLVVVPILTFHLSYFLVSLEGDSRHRPWISRSAAIFNKYSSNILSFETRFKGFLYPGLAVLLLVGLCLNQGQFAGTKILDSKFDEKRFPVKAAEFLASQMSGGHIFTTDYWGGFLIYQYYPKIKVFIDGRSDMYGQDLVKEYQKLTDLDYSWKSILDKYEINWIMLPVDYGLATALKELRNWQAVYDDHKAIIFVRRK